MMMNTFPPPPVITDVKLHRARDGKSVRLEIEGTLVEMSMSTWSFALANPHAFGPFPTKQRALLDECE